MVHRLWPRGALSGTVLVLSMLPLPVLKLTNSVPLGFVMWSSAAADKRWYCAPTHSPPTRKFYPPTDVCNYPLFYCLPKRLTAMFSWLLCELPRLVLQWFLYCSFHSTFVPALFCGIPLPKLAVITARVRGAPWTRISRATCDFHWTGHWGSTVAAL